MVFKEGEKIRVIFLTDGASIRSEVDCDSIVVSLESGQMACVPWFDVIVDGKVKTRWNAALVEGVELY